MTVRASLWGASGAALVGGGYSDRSHGGEISGSPATPNCTRRKLSPASVGGLTVTRVRVKLKCGSKNLLACGWGRR